MNRSVQRYVCSLVNYFTSDDRILTMNFLYLITGVRAVTLRYSTVDVKIIKAAVFLPNLAFLMDDEKSEIMKVFFDLWPTGVPIMTGVVFP